MFEGTRPFVRKSPGNLVPGKLGPRVDGGDETPKSCPPSLSPRQKFSGRRFLLGRRPESVETWRGGVRSSMSVSAPFVWRCLSGSTISSVWLGAPNLAFQVPNFVDIA